MADDENRNAILSRRQKLIAAAISSALIGGSAQACACLSTAYLPDYEEPTSDEAEPTSEEATSEESEAPPGESEPDPGSAESAPPDD